MSKTLGEAIQAFQQAVQQQSQTPRLDAEVLMSHLLDKPRSFCWAHPEWPLTDSHLQQWSQWTKQRLQGVPVAYLTGHHEFWGMRMRVNRHTLIPRPDSEALVETVLALPLPDREVVCAEVGVGSGALLCALASERPQWCFQAVDICPHALEVAKQNASQWSSVPVAWAEADACAAWQPHSIDVLYSNPPYIANTDACLGQDGVCQEPRLALVAEQQAPQVLRASGWLVLEHGSTQGPKVRAEMSANGFSEVCSHMDLAGFERVSMGQWCPAINPQEGCG
jgi:release factor glutamine methyltransferase